MNDEKIYSTYNTLFRSRSFSGTTNSDLPFDVSGLAPPAEIFGFHYELFSKILFPLFFKSFFINLVPFLTLWFCVKNHLFLKNISRNERDKNERKQWSETEKPADFLNKKMPIRIPVLFYRKTLRAISAGKFMDKLLLDVVYVLAPSNLWMHST